MKKIKNNQAQLIQSIENALAQTQCRLCEYEDCRAYAEAIVEQGESIDRCAPGGEKTLRMLASLTQKNPEPYVETVKKNQKGMTLTIIREDECIGCTQCIQACPVDAIIGSHKQMHTVINQVCNGCERCLPVCPMDCIDTITHSHYSSPHEINRQSHTRYVEKQKRAKKESKRKTFKKEDLTKRQAKIREALIRKKGL